MAKAKGSCCGTPHRPRDSSRGLLIGQRSSTSAGLGRAHAPSRAQVLAPPLIRSRQITWKQAIPKTCVYKPRPVPSLKRIRLFRKLLTSLRYPSGDVWKRSPCYRTAASRRTFAGRQHSSGLLLGLQKGRPAIVLGGMLETRPRRATSTAPDRTQVLKSETVGQKRPSTSEIKTDRPRRLPRPLPRQSRLLHQRV
jgi:hypothetical protein